MGGPGDAAQGSVDPPKGLSMNQESNSPGPIPKTGLVISIQAKSKEAVAATVISHSSSEIRVKLARPRSQVPFRSGERVRIKYWDEGTVAYYWEAKVWRWMGIRRWRSRSTTQALPCSGGDRIDLLSGFLSR